jgi:hypothetical protein
MSAVRTSDQVANRAPDPDLVFPLQVVIGLDDAA